MNVNIADCIGPCLPHCSQCNCKYMYFYILIGIIIGLIIKILLDKINVRNEQNKYNDIN